MGKLLLSRFTSFNPPRILRPWFGSWFCQDHSVGKLKLSLYSWKVLSFEPLEYTDSRSINGKNAYKLFWDVHRNHTKYEARRRSNEGHLSVASWATERNRGRVLLNGSDKLWEVRCRNIVNKGCLMQRNLSGNSPQKTWWYSLRIPNPKSKMLQNSKFFF
jgi:hypothetical protein